MNSYKIQCYHSKELIDDSYNHGIDIRSQIKYQMICQFFKENSEYINGGSFNFSFLKFDWKSEPTLENVQYHHIIKNCIEKQHNFYELTININRKV